jgi:hypothetical protein
MDIVNTIFDEIKFSEFLIEISKRINIIDIIRIKSFIGICNQLNDTTFEKCTTSDFITQAFNIDGECITQYKELCILFRTKCKEKNIISKVNGHEISYSINN